MEFTDYDAQFEEITSDFDGVSVNLGLGAGWVALFDVRRASSESTRHDDGTSAAWWIHHPQSLSRCFEHVNHSQAATPDALVVWTGKSHQLYSEPERTEPVSPVMLTALQMAAAYESSTVERAREMVRKFAVNFATAIDRPMIEQVVEIGPSEGPLETLRRLRARDELAEIQRDEVVAAAIEDGYSQRQVARSLGVTQPTIHRILRRVNAVKDGLIDHERRRVRTVLLKYAAGEIGRRTLWAELGTLTAGVAAPGQQDGYTPGSFDEVVRAFSEELIDEDLYTELWERHRDQEQA